MSEGKVDYTPFWEQLKRKEISQYKLLKDYKISNSLLNTLKNNRNINVLTLGRLCKILDCTPNDIVTFED